MSTVNDIEEENVWEAENWDLENDCYSGPEEEDEGFCDNYGNTCYFDTLN